jgi:hypothetical protein
MKLRPRNSNAFKAGHGHVFQAEFGEGGNMRSFVDGHEIVKVIEIALPIGAPLVVCFRE